MPTTKKKTTGGMGGVLKGVGGVVGAPTTATAGVHQALLNKISAKLKEELSPSELLELAEAYAWVNSPDQAHGNGGS